MNTSSIKNQARIIGILFFIVMILWAAGYAILDSLINVPDYLSSIYPNKAQIRVGVLFELLEAAAVMSIAFLLFPILKLRSNVLAISYMGFRVFEVMMLIVSVLCSLLLISLSQQYVQSGVADATQFETLGFLIKDMRLNWSFYILSLFHPLAALPLYYFLYRTKLIPRLISSWGFLAALGVLLDEFIAASFGFGLLQLGGTPISGMAMGLNEIVLGLWLIIKGFKMDAYNKLTSESSSNT